MVISNNTKPTTKQQWRVFCIRSVTSTKDGEWGGSLQLIEEQTFSGVSAVDFTSIQEEQYDVHFLTVQNTIMSGGESSVGIQFYENGVLETASVAICNSIWSNRWHFW